MPATPLASGVLIRKRSVRRRAAIPLLICVSKPSPPFRTSDQSIKIHLHNAVRESISEHRGCGLTLESVFTFTVKLLIEAPGFY